MDTALAEYYVQETDGWQTLLDFYLEDIDTSESLLKEVLHLNTVPHLSESTERHLASLQLSRQTLLLLRQRILDTEPLLYDDHAPVINDDLKPFVITQMKELRKDLYNAEKDYLEKKYYCDDFLADTIAIQSNTGGHKA